MARRSEDFPALGNPTWKTVKTITTESITGWGQGVSGGEQGTSKSRAPDEAKRI